MFDVVLKKKGASDLKRGAKGRKPPSFFGFWFFVFGFFYATSKTSFALL
jgi:hypothetical protein